MINDAFNKIRNKREEEFLLVLSRLFPQIPNLKPLKYEVKGLTIFPQGVIAVIVSPVTEDDYLWLQIFRHYVYTDEILKELNVERKRPFVGHITLFYIEEELSGEDRVRVADAVIDINRSFFPKPLPFNVRQAEVRKFEDFSAFYRMAYWPVHIF